MNQTRCSYAEFLPKSLPEMSCSGWKSCRYVPVRTSSTTVGSRSTFESMSPSMVCWWLPAACSICRQIPQSQPSNHHTAGHVFAGSGFTEECIECILAGVYDWNSSHLHREKPTILVFFACLAQACHVQKEFTLLGAPTCCSRATCTGRPHRYLRTVFRGLGS